MSWIRSRLIVMTAFVAATHVTAIAATSLALCCAPHHHAAEASDTTADTETGVACPLHRGADETCSMPQCPMHGETTHEAPGTVPTTAHEHHAEHGPAPHHATALDADTIGTGRHDDTGTRPSAPHCQLVCDDDELSPVVVLGHPGLLPPAGVVPTPEIVTTRVALPSQSLTDAPRPVVVPPPRS